MKIKLLILFSFISLVAYSQDTPYIKPVTLTNMSAAGYRFKQATFDTSLKTQKLLVEDTSHLKGVAYASLAPQGDSSKRIATTAWSKKWIAENVSPGVAGQPTAAWSYNGNIGDTASYDGLLGMLDNYPLKVITNGVVRLIVPENGINRSAGAANKVLMYDTTTKKLYYTDMESGGGGGSGTIYVVNQHGLIIDSLTAGVYKLAVDSSLFATQYDLSSGLAGKLNISDTAAMLSPYLRSGTAATTYQPIFGNQSAWHIYGNHTSGSATPTFGKLNVNSIDATGTPSGSTVLYGNGTWGSVVPSQWTTTGSDIYYNIGKVGIGTSSPNAYLNIKLSGLGTNLNDSNGIMLSNSTAATSGNPQNSPIFSQHARGFNTTTGLEELYSFRWFAAGVSAASSLPRSTYYLQVSSNGGAYSNLFTIQTNSLTVAGNIASTGGVTSGGPLTASTTVTSADYIASNAIPGNFNSNSNQGFRAWPTINSTTGTKTYTAFSGAPTITTNSGLSIVGFSYAPTGAALSGTPNIAFTNTVGDNILNTTSGSTVVGGTTPTTTAKLEVQSTITGFLPPRMTATQAEAISSPAEGLLIYATDGTGSTITSKGWWGYNGSAWVKLN